MNELVCHDIMPRNQRTITEFEKLPTYFELLATIHYIDFNDAAFLDDYPIQKERFLWRLISRKQ